MLAGFGIKDAMVEIGLVWLGIQNYIQTTKNHDKFIFLPGS